jgi:pimeloyl-ACP methyl ester carboxylesterase
MNKLRAPVALALVLALPAALPAQPDRYELGQRLRAFERAYDAQPDVAARKRAVAPLKQATFLFFAGQLGEAGHMLDRARRALAAEKEPEAAALWAESLVLRPGSRLLDRAAPEIPWTLAPFYTVPAKQPPQARLRCTLVRTGGKPVAGPAEVALNALPLEGKLPLAGVAEGDYLLRAEVVVGGRVLARGEQTVSLAERLASRLEKVRQAVKSLADQPRTTDKETARHLAALLADLGQKKTLETNFPAARLLAEAEALLESIRAGKSYYGRGRPGQFWLALAAGEAAVPARVQVPEALKEGRRVPLVVALHGAKGSENLFFDGYGDGRIARLCAERGWLLVAPRGGLAPGLIEEVSRLYPVDPRRVFLVGHSLGAAQAVGAAGRQPQRFAGVAALGGGGGLTPSKALRELPFFLGIGSEDFVRPGALSLRDRLRQAGVREVAFREYPDVEHLLVVQRGLRDVFAFFDEAAKR